MTAQLPSKERLERVIQLNDIYDPELTKALARFALAAHEQEPIGAFHISGGTVEATTDYCKDGEWPVQDGIVEVYANPAPVPAVSMPADLHPDTQKLVSDFSAALAEKLYKAQLKYGYSANWKNDDWQEECLKHFHQHIAKGDPRDVAAYCAFIWYHGWNTESQSPVPAIQPMMFIDGDISSEDADKLAKVIREFNEEDERPLAKMARIIRENPHPTNECDMPRSAPVPAVPEDYFASLVIAARLRAEKAMRKFPQPNYVLNKVAEESGEVIKAVIHYTEGREEWANVEGEIIDNLAMLIRLVTEGDQVIGFTPPESCRAAMLQGVVYAETPTTMQTAPALDSSPKIAELPSGNSPVIPDGWVACVERMPSAGEQVLAYRPDAPESNDPLIKMATYVGGSAHGHGFDCYCKPTHWMPLPAAPQQEVK